MDISENSVLKLVEFILLTNYKHDRIEVSSTHRYATGAGKEISLVDPMATGVIYCPAGALYEGSKLEMIKIEF